MTEAEWLAGPHPSEMLAAVARTATDRQLSLLVAAICRVPTFSAHLTYPPIREVVHWVELVAEGEGTWERVRAVVRRLPQRRQGRGHRHRPARVTPGVQAEVAFRALLLGNPEEIAEHLIREAAPLLGTQLQRPIVEIFGNPFRWKELDPVWLAWNDGVVPNLARTIYDERAFDRLPILGDALEQAGCEDADILVHCRSEGPHVRGCWVLDLVLEKE